VKFKYLSIFSAIFLIGIALTSQLNHSKKLEIVENKSLAAKTTEIVQNRETNRSGIFSSGETSTQGNIQLITKNGKSSLELEQDFKTSNGPDLVVILHKSNNILGSSQPPNYPLQENDYLILAPLQKNNGAQSYSIPNNINLADYQSVAIWCRKFNATFGAAVLK
jgi:Electron transfer DM13